MQNVLSCAFGIFDFKNDIFGGFNLTCLSDVQAGCRLLSYN